MARTRTMPQSCDRRGQSGGERGGSDELAVLLADVNKQQAQEVAERVVRTLNELLFRVFDAIELRAKCSVGIALAGHDDAIEGVLARADGALYEAKSVGRNAWREAAPVA